MLLLDLVYLLALVLLAPWLVWRAASTGRYRRDLAAKFLGQVTVPNPENKPVAWFHAVSVGEVNVLGTLVPAFRKRRPEWLVVVSSTTDTGLAEARRRFADLPENARRYVARLEEVSGVPAAIISTGSERDDTIFRDEVVKSALSGGLVA